jgi:hypothetical protein
MVNLIKKKIRVVKLKFLIVWLLKLQYYFIKNNFNSKFKLLNKA